MSKGNGRGPGAAPEQAPQVPTGEIDQGLGEVYVPLPKPVKLGAVSAQEVQDLKARNAVMDRLNRDIEFMSRTRSIAANERVGYLRMLGLRFGLGPRDEFSVDDNNGTVEHLGRRAYVQPEPEAQPEPELVGASDT